jgi:hypothetical protein
MALAIIPAALLIGCGTNYLPMGTAVPVPLQASPATVVLELSSTANDSLTDFSLQINSITLTSQSGLKEPIFVPTKPQNIDFIHLNGIVSPIAIVSIPQDTYVSASVSIGSSGFTCDTVTTAGGLLDSTDGYGLTSFSDVKLPSPITVSGEVMGLTLSLQASSSETSQGCGTQTGYAITPTFTLTPVIVAAQPTNGQNGKLSEMKGEVASVDVASASFTLTTNEGYAVASQQSGVTLSFNTSGSTVFGGISGLSALAPGEFVDMDAAIQSDGSLLATRIMVNDIAAIDTSVGPVAYVSGPEPSFIDLGRQVQGTEQIPEVWYYSFTANTSFQISNEFTNLSNLPFTASFNGTNFVGGQKVWVSFQTLGPGSFPYTQVDSVTLEPQTINGTVSAVSNTGNFNVYVVSLAAYDLFPTLTGQAALSYTLKYPGIVTVYVDAGAQLLNSSPVALGSVLRFHGLVFNDNGTLRMDCNQINDGVPE